MCARKRTVILAAAAQVDLNDILLFTWQQWGAEQRDRYEVVLERAIAGLADYPEIGVFVPRLCAECRARPVERHVLYYRILGDAIEVVRILHERTDPTRHLRR